MTEPTGHIYVIGSATDHGPVKIGWSNDPVARLGQAQIYHHDDLLLIASMPGTKRDEAKIHRRLRAARCRGRN